MNATRNNRGNNNPAWKGGRHFSDGYVRVYAPWHPAATGSRRNYVSEHRLVMEATLGRFLKEGECIHHINGNRTDNPLENLILFKSNSAHKKYHHNPPSPQAIAALIAYAKARKKPRDEMVSCACGCGESFPRYDNKARERKYKHGHNQRGKHWRWNNATYKSGVDRT